MTDAMDEQDKKWKKDLDDEWRKALKLLAEAKEFLKNAKSKGKKKSTPRRKAQKDE